MGIKKKKYKYEYSYRAYIGKGDDGKYHYKRFTGYSNTSMKQAKMDAYVKAETSLRATKLCSSTPMITLRQAYMEYIAVKENILSPVTVRGYTVLANNTFQQLMDTCVTDINQIAIQSVVNQLAAHHSPKYVRNAHGLLSAVLAMYRPEFVLHTTLPRKGVSRAYIPDSDDIGNLLREVQDTDPELHKAILLAAFGSLRRSEICALTTDDIVGDVIKVSKAVVPNKENLYVTKDTTKSEAGTRDVTFPHEIILKLRNGCKSGRIVEISPHIITSRFGRFLKKHHIQHFRFHDLRHYQASILHAMGVPDKYIMERCGWKTASTMKNIYQHTMSAKRKQVESEICDYFSKQFGESI